MPKIRPETKTKTLDEINDKNTKQRKHVMQSDIF